jgi:predicted dehydrogenase
MEKEVQLGIIGIGGMGKTHVRNVLEGRVKRCRLAAIADIAPAAMEGFEGPEKFTDPEALIRSGKVDAVVIATPHYFHTTLGITALNQGLHVATEKPFSVHKRDAERLLAARTEKSKLLATLFLYRGLPVWKKMKALLEAGAFGKVHRIFWTVTDQFRPDAYFAGAAWRGSWKTEGGGVMTNQCPHDLDLAQWLFGMPSKVRGFCGLGKRHAIQVDDEVTAYFEYPSGATGVFVYGTGEAPGTNRLEVAAEMGRVVVERGRIHFTRNEVSSTEFARLSADAYAPPPVWEVSIPTPGPGGSHAETIQNFVDAILDGTPLMVPGDEAIRAVELANAILYSSLKNQTVELPLDSEVFERELGRLKDLPRKSG